MSMSEKLRHLRKGESKAHSLAHKYDARKLASVVNHNYFNRHHTTETALGDKK